MMTNVLKLCFEPVDADATINTGIVIDLGCIASRRWKAEMTSKKSEKKTHEHISFIKGIRSEVMLSDDEKLAGKRIKATNNLGETPFAMIKETKRRCGTNMSLGKCAGEAMLRGNNYVDRTGDNTGWLLVQPEWVQECIIVYSEEQALKEETAHKKAITKYGAHLLTRFQEESEINAV